MSLTMVNNEMSLDITLEMRCVRCGARYVRCLSERHFTSTYCDSLECRSRLQIMSDTHQRVTFADGYEVAS